MIFNLLSQEKALELYKKSIAAYDSENRFFLDMKEIYEYLSPHGITEADYESILDSLRQFCATLQNQ